MALQYIDLDTTQPNGKPGDPARTAFGKVNNNTTILQQVLDEQTDQRGDLNAEIAAREALAQTVAGKANSSTVTDLSSTVTDLSSTVTAQGEAISLRATTAALTAETNSRTAADTAVNNIIATYKSAAKADILGVVAMSGGVPSGAVMETGTNANGNYYKFANGLLVCTYLGGPYTVATGGTLNVGWRTFAAAFSAPPIVALHVNSSFPYLVTQNCEPGVSQTAVAYSLRNGHTASLTIYAGFVAVGRWN